MHFFCWIFFKHFRKEKLPGFLYIASYSVLHFKMFELSGWRKIWRLWLEGGDGSVWMGKDLCLLKLKMFYRCYWNGVQDLPQQKMKSEPVEITPMTRVRHNIKLVVIVSLSRCFWQIYILRCLIICVGIVINRYWNIKYKFGVQKWFGSKNKNQTFFLESTPLPNIMFIRE